MKLIFVFFEEPGEHIPTNNGVQYFNIKNVPFKIGDYVKFREGSYNHFGYDVRNKKFMVTSMRYRIDLNDNNANVVITLDNSSDTICCSWVRPIISCWKRL